MKLLSKHVLTFLFSVIAIGVYGQETNTKAEVDTGAFLQDVVSPKTALPVDIKFLNSLENKVDSAEKAALLATEIKYHQYMFTQRMNIYNWQLTSAKVIFFVVCAIVVMGLILSYLQFKASNTQTMFKLQQSTAGNTTISGNTETGNTKLEISKEGIKIDSAVIGLIILVLSIVFFFLYLKYVFPIQTPTQ